MKSTQAQWITTSFNIVKFATQEPASEGHGYDNYCMYRYKTKAITKILKF